MNCWGWATWADRWAQYSKDPKRLLTTWSRERREAFNVGGAHNFFAQVENNAAGRTNTWAIFWYATIFERGGFCLNPARSFVQNIGLDGSGEHCGSLTQAPFEPSLAFNDDLPDFVEENGDAVARIREHLQPPMLWRVGRRALNCLRRLPHV